MEDSTLSNTYFKKIGSFWYSGDSHVSMPSLTAIEIQGTISVSREWVDKTSVKLIQKQPL